MTVRPGCSVALETLFDARALRLRFDESQIVGRKAVRLSAGHLDAAARSALRQLRAVAVRMQAEDLHALTAGHADARIVALFDRLASAFDRGNQGQRTVVVQRGDAETDRQQRRLRERHHAFGADLDAVAFGGPDPQAPVERATAQIQRTLELQPFGLIQAYALVAQPQADALAFGHRHARVGAAREAGQALVVVDGILLEHRRQETAVAGTVVFLEAATHAQRSVGQREQAFVARPLRRLEAGLLQAPRIDRRLRALGPTVVPDCFHHARPYPDACLSAAGGNADGEAS